MAVQDEPKRPPPRRSIRPRVEAIQLHEFQKEGPGYVAYLKLSQDTLGRWTIGGLCLGRDGRLVQDEKSREPCETTAPVLSYFGEVLSRMERDVRNRYGGPERHSFPE